MDLKTVVLVFNLLPFFSLQNALDLKTFTSDGWNITKLSYDPNAGKIS